MPISDLSRPRSWRKQTGLALPPCRPRFIWRRRFLLKIAEQATEAGVLLHACSAGVKPRVRSDLTVGLMLAIAAAEAGRHTVEENIKIQHNQRLKSSLLDRIRANDDPP